MSILPLLFSDWWQDLEGPHHLHDQQFGSGMHPHYLSESSMQPKYNLYKRMMEPRYRQHQRGHHYPRPWAELMRSRQENEGGLSTVKADKDKFQVALDVQQFLPEEIHVKVRHNLWSTFLYSL